MTLGAIVDFALEAATPLLVLDAATLCDALFFDIFAYFTICAFSYLVD